MKRSDRKGCFARRFAVGASMAFALSLVVGCETGEPVKLPPPPPEKKVETPPAQPAKTTTVKAGVGVGKKGRGYGQGLVATPAASYFAMKEKITFEIQIPHAMQLYKATEGHAPKTHEEYMEKIIKANGIPLPELPDGATYRYDPAREELMIDGLAAPEGEGEGK